MTRARQEEGRRRSVVSRSRRSRRQRAASCPRERTWPRERVAPHRGVGRAWRRRATLPEPLMALSLAGCGGCGHSSARRRRIGPVGRELPGTRGLRRRGRGADHRRRGLRTTRTRGAVGLRASPGHPICDAFLSSGTWGSPRSSTGRSHASSRCWIRSPSFPSSLVPEVEQIGLLPVGRAAAEASLARRFLGTPRTPVHSSLPGRFVYSTDLPGGVHFIALDNVSQRGLERSSSSG